MGFDHNAGTYVPCSDRVDPHGSQESERRSVIHCQAVPETAGSDGSCVQRDIFWPAVHETPTVVAQDQGVLPKGKPASHDQGHAVMPTCLRHVEETLVLSQGLVLGAPLSPRNASDRRVPHGWGAVMSGHPARGLWSGRHLTWHINCLEMLAVFRALKHFLPDLRDRHVLVRTDNTAVVFYINHQGGLRSRPLLQAGAPDPCVGPRQASLAESSSYSWASQYGSRHPVEAGAEARDMDASSRVGEADMESFGQAQVDLFATRQTSHCPLWFSLTHPAPLGLDAMVQTWPRLRLYAFPPIALLPGVLEECAGTGSVYC